MKYTPSDFIYYEIVEDALNDEGNILKDDYYLSLENAEDIYLNPYEYFKEGFYRDVFYNITNEMRELGEEHNVLLKESSRHFEIDYYVREFTGVTEDGETISKWIGWNYYYGGSKHAYPEDIDWISSAEFVRVKSEEVVSVIKRTFEREAE